MLSDVDLLGLLVQADESVNSHQSWYLFPSAGVHCAWVGCEGWPDNVALPSAVQIDDLQQRGWVRVTEYDGDRGRRFAVTTLGREDWARHLASQAHVPGHVDLGWEAAKPVLCEIFVRYQDAGAPEMGVDVSFPELDEDAARQNAAVIRELFHLEMLEEPALGVDQSNKARPAAKALQMLAAWPAAPAEESLNELVRAIDGEIAATTDQAKRRKLIAVRDGIVTVGRDVALAYFEKRILGL